MKKLKTFMVKRIAWGIIALLMLAGCSLNNPFLATEELVVEPPKEEELPPPPPEPIHVESISVVSGTEIERLPGREYVLDYIIYPENADDKSVTITIDDEKVAILDKKTGKIFAGGEDCIGKSTVITVTTNDGKKVAKINFKVIPIPDNSVFVEEIVIEGVDVIYDDGNKGGFSAKLLPEDVSEEFKDVVWSITEKDVVQREQQGSIGLSIWRDNEITEETEITIRATSPHKKSAEDPDVYAEKKVKVKHKPRPKITVTSPNGGEEFTFKTDTTITWTTKDIESDKVKIELIDTATGIEYLLEDNYENQGDCYWYIDQSAEYKEGGDYKIRITAIPNADESADVVVSDESDEFFKLSKVVPTIELIAPKTKGSDEDDYFYLYETINMDITWLSTDMPADKVAIYLVKQNGDNPDDFTVVKQITGDEGVDNNGFFRWNLGEDGNVKPEDKESWTDKNSKYKIKIENLTYNDTLSAEEYEKNKVESFSDVTFSLEKVESPFLKFLAPTGKKLYIGTQNDITWEGVGFDSDVKIELVPEEKNKPSYSIVDRTPNDGCFEWNISEEVMVNGDFDLGTEYKIRISTIDGPIQYNGSDIKIMKDKDGNETRLENPGTLVAEGADSLEAILAPNVYFLLDDSGSMATSNRIGTLKKRMDNAAVALAKNFNIGIMSLNNTMKELPLKKGWTADDIRSSYAALKASGVTPTGPSLEKILNNKKYEMEDDIYNEHRRKAVVVITDGQPQDGSGTTQGFLDSFKNAVTKSSLLAGNGIPVFYMGINATGSLADKLQDMAVAGGTDNPKDESTPHKNWYPIDQDNQFEAALNEIMYGDLEVAGSMVEYEITCDTPDNGNSIYFFGDHLLLGGTTSPASASGLLKATYKDGKYSIKIRKQDNANFSWGIVEADSKGNILKIERPSLHSSDVTSTTFNGWDENVIIIKVKQSLGYNLIHYWNCSNKTGYPDTKFPGVKMASSGDDYVFTFVGTTSVELLITKANEAKLCGSDMKASSPGSWRVTSSGIKKEN